MPTHVHDPIAVVGSACRLPGGASSPSKLWQLLQSPKDVLSKIPADRFNVDGFYHEDGAHHGTMNVKESYFLAEDIRLFDTHFFGIKPVEARCIDPQHRLLLETVYEGLECAGIPLEKLGGSDTSVFVGQMCEDWSGHLQRDLDQVPVYTGTGIARSITSNRVSWFFDWHGPSVTIDTACSSSLVAVHQAILALRSGESRVAVAAGTNLILTPEMYIAESKLKMLSPDGRSRMWDADANGYARGEGVAALILKRLSDAVRDGDHVEFVIRETAVNSDGRTNEGITMPSATAQTALIRTAYKRAGLNIDDEKDRCQYFEAHGTGTPAGDPQEAKAIRDAFFGHGLQNRHKQLYVGSIKTVLGHAEGTAGIAGLMKAGLALQNRVIPPNMHFNKLSPNVAPFYDKLCITTEPLEWPALDGSDVRRASVNSFGFGGTNAHAILEAYEVPSVPTLEEVPTKHQLFIFSAATKASLFRMLVSYAAYLETCNDRRIQDLSYTLQDRRSELPVKIAFASKSVSDLSTTINNECLSALKFGDSVLAVRSSTSKSPNVLGIFTGQGAQWVSMGRELIRDFECMRDTLLKLDESLASLPEVDRPSWRIVEQLMNTDESTSRLNEANLSQPLCTAIQIGLVDLLRAVGVNFKAVVGHSSGEIAAAYSVGFHTAKDAIRIAYYRGLCVQRANADRTISGAMMAVGTTFEDAKELCELPEFEGRVCVAASNSPSSVTVSGDADAIDEMQVVLDDEKKVTKKLNVDTAYHSHHMQVCGSPYVEALDSCQIKVPSGPKACEWFSSVNNGARLEKSEFLPSRYWNDNMVSPVLFSQAVTSAIVHTNGLDAVIEIGPHPILRGPTTRTISEVLGGTAPLYAGVLSHGKNDARVFLDALGLLWSNFGQPSLDMSALRKLTNPCSPTPQLLKGLPTYSWEHTKQHWTESRISRAITARVDPVHILLGVKTIDTDTEVRWRNSLFVRDLSWVVGHQLQGQTVFPAAAYIVSVLEGVKSIAMGRPIKMIVIEDMTFARALTLEPNDDIGVEVQLIFAFDLKRNQNENVIAAEFRYNSSANPNAGVMTLNVSGYVRAEFGEPVAEELPQRDTPPPNMTEVNENLFYDNLRTIGYQYNGPFRALTSLKRVLGSASCVVRCEPDADSQPLMIHPGPLDSAIQTLLLALSWPGDGQLRELYVPTSIMRFRVNPYYEMCSHSKTSYLAIDTGITGDSGASVKGDIEIFPKDGQYAAIQLEGLEVKPFATATEISDRCMFSTWDWNVANPDAALAVSWQPNEQDKLVAEVTEHAAIYYLKFLMDTIKEGEIEKPEWFHKFIFHFADYVLKGVADGTRPFAKKEWLNTTRDEMHSEMEKLGNSVEVRLIKAVGENLPDAIRGKTQILQHMVKDDLLNDFYSCGRGMYEHTDFLANTVQQIIHRYGDLNIIEVGGGTGGATKKIFERVDQSFTSYVFTDISSGFFETAQETFIGHSKKMSFKTLDLEKDVVEQGFVQHSYDLVVASAVLHATSSLEQTLANVRQLLRPGGFLVALELTDAGPIRNCFYMAGLPGMWIGHDDARILGPCTSPERWDRELRNAGFSGVDMVTSRDDLFERPNFVFTTRATDDRVNYLDNPTLAPSPWHPEEVVILGGSKPRAQDLALECFSHFQACGIRTTVIHTLEEINSVELKPRSVVLSLTDLDQALFKDITSERMSGLQKLLETTEILLWVTKGHVVGDPYGSMTVGWARSMVRETPLLRSQFLDVNPEDLPSAKILAELLLCLDGTVKFRLDVSEQHILLSEESEVTFKNKKFFIPRLRPMVTANKRYNASKRFIKTERDPRRTALELVPGALGCTLREPSQLAYKNDLTDHVTIEVTHSYSAAVKVATSSHFFVVLGKEQDLNETVVALSTKNGSLVKARRDLTVPVKITPGKEASVVQCLFAELLAGYVTSDPLATSGIHVHDAPIGFLATFQRWSEARSIPVSFSTSRKSDQSPLTAFIHPQATMRAVNAIIPPQTTYCASFTAISSAESSSPSLTNAWPTRCKIERSSDLLTAAPVETSKVPSSVCKLLHQSIQAITSNPMAPSVTIATLESLGTTAVELDAHTVIHWTSTSASAQIQPIDSTQIFSSKKTYALFGLTSDLAQGICKWMVQHGAQHVVMTSRNPKIEDGWRVEMRALGANIKIYASDITDEESFERVHQDILNTMPPVGGIANGAMVLEDALFRYMTLETWQKVVQPKMCGSIFLDKYFRDHQLEFFIMFSSISCSHGNEGQSNYGAANMFSTGLVYERRQRGLRASVMHIGPVVGAGIMTRERKESVDKHIHDHGHAQLASTDVFTAFAEAMLAGRLELARCPEVVLDERENNGELSFELDPKYQFMNPKKEEIDISSVNKFKAPSLRVGLLGVVTVEQTFELVKDAFLSKLSTLLQQEATEQWKVESLNSSAVELGIDSLVAVHIRTWFLTEADVDVPVLKVLGGSTIGEIINFCVSKLPPKLVPKLQGSTSTPSAAFAGVSAVPAPTTLLVPSL